jgi:hypothetical protein
MQPTVPLEIISTRKQKCEPRAGCYRHWYNSCWGGGTNASSVRSFYERQGTDLIVLFFTTVLIVPQMILQSCVRAGSGQSTLLVQFMSTIKEQGPHAHEKRRSALHVPPALLTCNCVRSLYTPYKALPRKLTSQKRMLIRLC